MHQCIAVQIIIKIMIHLPSIPLRLKISKILHYWQYSLQMFALKAFLLYNHVIGQSDEEFSLICICKLQALLHLWIGISLFFHSFQMKNQIWLATSLNRQHFVEGKLEGKRKALRHSPAYESKKKWGRGTDWRRWADVGVIIHLHSLQLFETITVSNAQRYEVLKGWRSWSLCRRFSSWLHFAWNAMFVRCQWSNNLLVNWSDWCRCWLCWIYWISLPTFQSTLSSCVHVSFFIHSSFVFSSFVLSPFVCFFALQSPFAVHSYC